MSALWSSPAENPPSRPRTVENRRDRPDLRPVPPQPQPRLSRVPFALVLIAIIGVGMAGLLMLNTSLQNQAFEVRTVQRQATALAYTQAGLQQQADNLAAPEELARRASALGMRPNPLPAFLVLPSGKVLGEPHVVTGREVPSLVIKTPAQLAAEQRAAAAQAAAKQQVAEAVAAVQQAVSEVAQQAAAKQATANKSQAKAKQSTQTTRTGGGH